MKSRIICDLAPSDTNQRNSEGDFFTLPNGDILFAYSRYGQGFQDGDHCDIYCMISTDNAESFCEPFPVITAEQMDADNLMSVSLIGMKNEDIGLFFLKKKGDTCIPYFARSNDCGKTWSCPVPCIGCTDYYVLNNDRVIYTEDVILLPMAHHKWFYAEENGVRKRKGISPGTLCIVASYDDGKSFETLLDGMRLPQNIETGVQEPGITKLPDGTLWCYIRNSSGKQYQCFSQDNGKSWTEPEPSVFSSPCSPLSATRLSDGRVVAVWNPIPEEGRETTVKGIWTGARNPLVIAFSDDGRNFGEQIEIENNPESGFAYTAIHELPNKSLLLAYCAGGRGDGCMLNRLRIRKIEID